MDQVKSIMAEYAPAFIRADMKTAYMGKTRAGRPLFKLLEPIIWHSSAGKQIMVPAGFITDGATSPQWSWPVFPPVGQYFAAAALHDWLCVKRQTPDYWAHREFYKACRALDVPQWKSAVMYLAVKYFGARWVHNHD